MPSFTDQPLHVAREAATSLRDRLADRAGGMGHTALARSAITIGRPRGQVADAFCDPGPLAVVLGEVGDVHATGDGTARWELRAPVGEASTTWDARLERTEDRVRWSSADGSGGTEVVVDLRDAPHDLGTEVLLSLQLPAPGGAIGSVLKGPVKAAGASAATRVLHRTRSLLETGEVPTLERNPSARRGDPTEKGR